MSICSHRICSVSSYFSIYQILLSRIKGFTTIQNLSYIRKEITLLHLFLVKPCLTDSYIIFNFHLANDTQLLNLVCLISKLSLSIQFAKYKKSVCKISNLILNSSFEGKIFWFCIDFFNLGESLRLWRGNSPTSQTVSSSTCG